MIVLAEPAPEDMVQAIKKAINMLPDIDPQAMHLQVSLNPPPLCKIIVALTLSILSILQFIL